jgi:muramoyltetrapeptide carboxypeptidase LdcA involved in peptidoglycan recycling
MAQLPDRTRRAEAVLVSLGFRITRAGHALCISDDGTKAGSPQDRANDLMEAFADPGVDAVLAADAGMGSHELLDFLDPAIFRASAKPFIGYCDNVAINQYLASRAGLSSLYGCTLMAHLGEAGGTFPETTDYLLRALDSTAPLACLPVDRRTGEFVNWHVPGAEKRRRKRTVPGGWTWLRPGTGAGPLLGGEIRLIPELTDMFSLSWDGTVLFWHIAFNAPPPEPLIRRMAESIDLTRLAGMIVGAHPAIPLPEWAAVLSDLLDELVPDTGYPVLANADISHLDPAWTVPYGEEVSLSFPGTVRFERGTTPKHELRGEINPGHPAA